MPAPDVATPVAEPTAARKIDKSNPRIVILGGGFAGLNLAKSLRHVNARITLIDRQNHHLFQPLLYQVATATLSTVEIAQPLRSILSDYENIEVELGDVQAIDLKARQVRMHHRTVDYDYLVIAVGGVTNYFGHPEWAEYAPGLKSINDAMCIRREILYAFEKAELAKDPQKLQQLTTIVIVGGGPTGVELAGACKELGRFVLRHDFRRIDPTKVRVILIEASSRILVHLPRDLSDSAHRQLEEIGVEIRTDTTVKDIRRQTVVVASKENPEVPETISAAVIVWAAGVGAHPITRTLGVELDRAGRIEVKPDLSLPEFPEVFAIGDIALVLQSDGTPVPGVSPAAIQMGQFVARLIETDMADPHLRPEQRDHFKYRDKGTMATIGRSRAVAMIGPFKFSGFPAWLAWLGVHILFLIGFTNKVTVIIRWAWSYFTGKQGARVFTAGEGRGVSPVAPPSTESTAAPTKAA